MKYDVQLSNPIRVSQHEYAKHSYEMIQTARPVSKRNELIILIFFIRIPSLAHTMTVRYCDHRKRIHVLVPGGVRHKGRRSPHRDYTRLYISYGYTCGCARNALRTALRTHTGSLVTMKLHVRAQYA